MSVLIVKRQVELVSAALEDMLFEQLASYMQKAASYMTNSSCVVHAQGHTQSNASH